MDPMGPPPYELRLSERPQDRVRFNDQVTWLLWRSRPGHMYRVPWWAGPKRRYRVRQQWEDIVCSFMGNAYLLGRER